MVTSSSSKNKFKRGGKSIKGNATLKATHTEPSINNSRSNIPNGNKQSNKNTTPITTYCAYAIAFASILYFVYFFIFRAELLQLSLKRVGDRSYEFILSPFHKWQWNRTISLKPPMNIVSTLLHYRTQGIPINCRSWMQLLIKWIWYEAVKGCKQVELNTTGNFQGRKTVAVSIHQVPIYVAFYCSCMDVDTVLELFAIIRFLCVKSLL